MHIGDPTTGYKPAQRRNPLTGQLHWTLAKAHHAPSAYNECAARVLRGRAGSIEAQIQKMRAVRGQCAGAVRRGTAGRRVTAAAGI